MSNNPLNMHPVDYFNFYGSFKFIFEGQKYYNMITDNECGMMNPYEPNTNDLNHTSFKHDPCNGLISVTKANAFRFPQGATISKYMLLCAVKFKFDDAETISFITHELMGIDVPYLRIGTDYFKIIKKRDRYGAIQTILKGWKKDEIKEDHSKSMLKMLLKYDDFTILPNNKEFIPTENNCYNLYSQFPHQPANHSGSITATINMLKHIFGEQFETALKYMKVLYENPRQILPVLVLVSKERDTGKTTFLNWISMLFGNNAVLVSPEDLSSHFNSGYATKNIIMIDETVIERSASVERVKSLATAKTISISQKFVQGYSVPFFGKIIFCTNKVHDFMRIDKEEIRFWVRKVNAITGEKNTAIEDDLFKEIPAFLTHLSGLPAIDFTKSRMVFTAEEINTDDLLSVKSESKSSLLKDMEILVDDFFNRNPEMNDFDATVKDIKERWFLINHQASLNYIRKVLKDEVGMLPSAPRYYKPFGDALTTYSGRPYTFMRP